MPIEFSCSSCGSKLRVPDGSAGKKAKCPTCQTVNVIPGAASNPDGAASMPSPLDDPFGLQDEDLLRNTGNQGWEQDWGIDDFQETDNPFQAPQDFDGVSRPASLRITGTIRPSKLYLGQTIAETFRNFFSNIVPYLITSVAMILSYAVVYGIMFAGLFLAFPQVLGFEARPVNAIAIWVFMFLAVFFVTMIALGVLGIGFLSCFIDIAKNRESISRFFFQGYKEISPLLRLWDHSVLRQSWFDDSDATFFGSHQTWCR